MESDSLSLQNTFRSWLHDCGTDSEHLHLTLPPPSTLHEALEEEGEEYGTWRTSCYDSEGVARAEEDERGLVMKCDIHERIIDPSTSIDSKIGRQFVSKYWTSDFFLAPTPLDL